MAALWKQKQELRTKIHGIMVKRVGEWDCDKLAEKFLLVHGAYTETLSLDDLIEMYITLNTRFVEESD